MRKTPINAKFGVSSGARVFFFWSESLSTFMLCRWATSRQNLSLGFPTKRDSKQCPKLQRLARKVEFCMEQA